MLWIFGMDEVVQPLALPVRSQFYIELERIQSALNNISQQLDAIAQELRLIAEKLDEIGKKLEELCQKLALDTQEFRNSPDLYDDDCYRNIDKRKSQNGMVLDWIKQTGPKMLLLGGCNGCPRLGEDDGMKTRPGYDSNQWVMFNLGYGRRTLLPDEPGLVGDFNSPNFEEEIARPFARCFSRIVFDCSTVQFVMDHTIFIKHLAQMLTPNGQLYYEFPTSVGGGIFRMNMSTGTNRVGEIIDKCKSMLSLVALQKEALKKGKNIPEDTPTEFFPRVAPNLGLVDGNDSVIHYNNEGFLKTLFNEVRVHPDFQYSPDIRPQHKHELKTRVVYVCSNPIQAE